MVTVGLITTQKEEALRLAQILHENHYKIQYIPNTPNTTHLALMKAKPDIILVELPRNPYQVLDIIQDIHYNKLLSKIPIIGFGTHTDHQIIRKFTSVGIIKYLLQPLRLKLLLHIMETLSVAKYKELTNNKKVREYTTKEETDMLLDSNILAGLKIEHMVKKIDKLLSFPFTVSKFVEVTESPQYSADDLVKVIKLDPGLSATILKAANSVEYGTYSRVSDFKEAIMRIGFEETKKIVISVKIIDALPRKSNHLDFDRESYWYHSICNAVIAEKIAKKIKFVKPGYAFLAGLLHDYPTLLYDEYFGVVFDKVLHKSSTSFTSIDKASRELLGFIPSEFIVDLAHKWGLPNEVINALRYYKSFIHLPSKLSREEEKQLITIVGISDILSKVIRFGRSSDEYIHPIPFESLQLLKFNAGVPLSFLDSIPADIQRLARLLGLNRRTFPDRCFSLEGEEPFRVVVIQSQRAFFEPHIHFIECSDIQTVTYQTLGALEQALDGDNAPDLVVFNELPGDDPDFFNPFFDLLELYPPNKIIFTEKENGSIFEEDERTRVLPKKVDIRQIIQAIDTFTIDLEDITR